ncbi:hypothetical protein D3C71_1960930 [compost metagenome]
MHNGVGNTQTAEHHAKKVEQASHNDRKLRAHSTGVNYSSDRIGRIMEAVNGLIEQHEQQCEN